jgi:hypothetical protein
VCPAVVGGAHPYFLFRKGGRMKKRGKFLAMSVFLASLFLLMNGISHAWEVPIVVNGDGIVDTLYFGTDPAATAGYDNGIDVLAPPPPPAGFYTAFYIGGTFPYLSDDKRASTDTLITWSLRTLGDAVTDSISWNPADLPTEGDFTLDGQDMRTQSVLVYSGNITKALTYHGSTPPPPPPPVTIPIIVDGDGIVDTLYFGMDSLGTNGYDDGIDVLAPPPPPAGFYTAFYIGGTFPYLTRDIRASSDTLIHWSLRTLGDAATDSISWNPADLPATGTFIFDTLTQKINMRIQDHAVYTGNQTLCLRYRYVLAVEETPVIPNQLLSSVPNPAVDMVKIAYTISEKSQVEIKVYNITGGLVRTLKSGVEEPGYKTAIWDMRDKDGKRVQSGIYFYKLQAGNFSTVKKMIVTK